MPFVPAICTQCGSKLRVDSSKEAAICPYCRTPFVTETAINNYNTNYTTNVEHLHADVVNLNDDKSIGSRVRSGETFIKLDDYAAAERIFKELTVECPYDYRGWWGLIKVRSRNFNDEDISRNELRYIEELYRNTCAVASTDEQNKIKLQYNRYHDYVQASLDTELKSVQDKMEYCKSTFKQKITPIEAEIKDCEQKAKSSDSVGRVLTILCCIVGVVATVVYTKLEGFGLGIIAGFIFLFIALFVWFLIGSLISILSILNGNSEENVYAQIKSLNAQLADYENAYQKEMAQLDKIMEKVR